MCEELESYNLSKLAYMICSTFLLRILDMNECVYSLGLYIYMRKVTGVYIYGKRVISPREISYLPICLPNYELIPYVSEIKFRNLFIHESIS